MEKQTAKELLSAYRANGADADDANLQEALLLAQRDPELKKWLESQIAFDQTLSNSINSIKGPEARKRAILATALLNEEPQKSSSNIVFGNWWKLTAIAAVITLGAILSFQFSNKQSPTITSISQTSWLTSVSQLADAALPLDKRGDEIEPLQNWLAQNGAPQATDLPTSLTDSAKLAGCRVFDLPNGKKASLLCFTQGNQLVHVFVVRKSDLDGTSIKEQSWEHKGDWNLFAWSEGDMLMTIASKLPADQITPLISRA